MVNPNIPHFGIGETSLSPAESLAQDTVDVLEGVTEIVKQKGSYTVHEKSLSRTALVDKEPGEATIKTERVWAVTTYSVGFEPSAVVESQGERKRYEWDVREQSLVIRITQPFTQGPDGKKQYGREEAKQVKLTPTVQEYVRKVIVAARLGSDTEETDG